MHIFVLRIMLVCESLEFYILDFILFFFMNMHRPTENFELVIYDEGIVFFRLFKNVHRYRCDPN